MPSVFFPMLTLIIALSVDAFTAGFAYGADKVKVPLLSAFIVSLLSGGILILSLLIGNLLQAYIPLAAARFLCFFILFLLGLVKLFDSTVKRLIESHRFPDKQLRFKLKNIRFILTIYAVPSKANTDDVSVLSPREAFSLGLALSLDSAAAGIGAASPEYSILLTGLTALAVGMAAVGAGSLLGKQLVSRTNLKLSWLSGALLILLALSKLI